MFGQEKLKSILVGLKDYDRNFSQFPVDMAYGALFDYYTQNSQNEIEGNEILNTIGEHLKFEQGLGTLMTGGVKKLNHSSFSNPSFDNSEAVKFLSSRFSCRMFSPEPIENDRIEEVVLTAQMAPSQCNRQSTRLHFYQNRDKIKELLELQAGASGFSQDIGNLFVVTSKVTAWGGPRERNQLYVDGGLYSMMLMLSLHAKGIACCPLNLAILNRVETRLKKIGNIPSDERLIMMIAIGKYLSPEIKVARSPRLNLGDVLTFHNGVELE